MAAILKKKIQKITKGEKAKMLSNPSLQKLKKIAKVDPKKEQLCKSFLSPRMERGEAQARRSGSGFYLSVLHELADGNNMP